MPDEPDNSELTLDPPAIGTTVRIAPPAEVAPLFGVGRLARHVLVCAGPKCCDPAVGGRVWGVFKRRLSELGLTGGRQAGPTVYRTRCDCLRMCADGPIVVVYPEGAWYQRVDEAAAERIITEHLIAGRVVNDDLCFALNPLAGGSLTATDDVAQITRPGRDDDDAPTREPLGERDNP